MIGSAGVTRGIGILIEYDETGAMGWLAKMLDAVFANDRVQGLLGG